MEDLCYTALALAVASTCPRYLVGVILYPLLCAVALWNLRQSSTLLNYKFTDSSDLDQVVCGVACAGSIVAALLFKKYSEALSLLMFVQGGVLAEIILDNTLDYQQTLALYGAVFFIAAALGLCIHFQVTALLILVATGNPVTSLLLSFAFVVAHEILIAVAYVCKATAAGDLAWVLVTSAMVGEMVLQNFNSSSLDFEAYAAVFKLFPVLSVLYSMANTIARTVLKPQEAVSWSTFIAVCLRSIASASGIVLAVWLFGELSKKPVDIKRLDRTTVLALFSAVVYLEAKQLTTTATVLYPSFAIWKKSFFSLDLLHKIEPTPLASTKSTTKKSKIQDIDPRITKANKRLALSRQSLQQNIKKRANLGSDRSLKERLEAQIQVLSSALNVVVRAEDFAAISRELAGESETMRNGFKSLQTQLTGKKLASISQASKEADSTFFEVHSEVHKAEDAAEKANEELKRLKRVAYSEIKGIPKENQDKEVLSCIAKLNELIEQSVQSEGKKVPVVDLHLNGNKALDSSPRKYRDSQRKTPSKARTPDGIKVSNRNLSSTFKAKKRPWWSRYGKSKTNSK